ncbi:SDR family NAD(P)-dependent oxidoreductase, partial [Chloroflexi bacterium TSY]|nr:SDR family NAD(P)-dependent oxidoreductase [Chloroflexi bacterium TSY]
MLTVAQSDASMLVSRLRAEMQMGNFGTVEEIRYGQTDGREVKTLTEIALDTDVETAYLKPGGVYWIPGGMGGLGRLFAQHLLETSQFEKGEGITLILTGRSSLDAAEEQLLAELNTKGSTVVYLQADISQPEAVEGVVERMEEAYGQINGIIHSAGVLRDSFIINKTEEEIEAVLGPKVDGILNIDASTQDMPLDFVVLFSSIAGVMGNVGQADYAAANAFLDTFADHRQALVAANERSGRTLSINWPLWDEGGMSVDEETAMRLTRELGLTALETSAGLAAFDFALTHADVTQLLVTSGNQQQINAYLTGAGRKRSVGNAQPIELSMAEEKQLFEATERYLKELLSDTLKLPAARMDANASWRDMADSILALSLTHQLEQHFGELPKTLFFEYQTLTDLTTYFVDAYPTQLQMALGWGVEGFGSKGRRSLRQLLLTRYPILPRA